jgi:hypothetical protein
VNIYHYIQSIESFFYDVIEPMSPIWYCYSHFTMFVVLYIHHFLYLIHKSIYILLTLVRNDFYEFYTVKYISHRSCLHAKWYKKNVGVLHMKEDISLKSLNRILCLILRCLVQISLEIVQCIHKNIDSQLFMKWYVVLRFFWRILGHRNINVRK